MNEVELLFDSGTLLGECPVWDVKENVPVSYTHLTLPTIYSV